MAGPAVRVLVDGIADAEVPANDRGFAYGDGVFRSIRVDEGRLWLWPDHLSKLSDDARRLGLELSAVDQDALQTEALRLIGQDSGTLRMVVTRGSGPRGDRPPVSSTLRRVLVFQAGETPAIPSVARSVRLCRVRLPRLPELAGVKHLNRLPQVLARQEWPGPLPDEGLLLDADGSVVCGTMTNVFLRRENRILTPALDQSGVAGIIRARLLAARVPGMETGDEPVTSAKVTLDDLLTAEEVWLTNAVVGVWPVATLEDAEGNPLARWQAPGRCATALAAGLVRLLESS